MARRAATPLIAMAAGTPIPPERNPIQSVPAGWVPMQAEPAYAAWVVSELSVP